MKKMAKYMSYINKVIYVLFLFGVMAGLFSCNAQKSSMHKNSIINNKNDYWDMLGEPHFIDMPHDNTKLVIGPKGDKYLFFRGFPNGVSHTGYLYFMKYWNNRWVAGRLDGRYSDVSIEGPGYLSVVVDNNDNVYVAFINENKAFPEMNELIIAVFRKGSGRWEQLGHYVNHGAMKYSSMAIDARTGLIYIAFSDYSMPSNGAAKVLTYDQTSNTWQLLGGLSMVTTERTDYNNLVIAPDGALYLAFSSYGFSLGRAVVVKYNTEYKTWEPVGDVALSNGVADYVNLIFAADGTPYLSFADQGKDGKARVLTYNNQSKLWHAVGPSLVSSGLSKYNNLAIAPDGTLYLAFKNYDASGSKISVLFFDKISQQWLPLNSPITPISAQDVENITLNVDREGIPVFAFNAGNIGFVKFYNQSIRLWIHLGQGYVATMASLSDFIISIDGNPYIMFFDAWKWKTALMKYNKLNHIWENIEGPYDYMSKLASSKKDGKLYLAAAGSAYVYDSDNQIWQALASNNKFEGRLISFNITADGNIYILSGVNQDQGLLFLLWTYNAKDHQWEKITQYQDEKWLTYNKIWFGAIAGGSEFYLAANRTNGAVNEGFILQYHRANKIWEKLLPTQQNLDLQNVMINPKGDLYLNYKNPAHEHYLYFYDHNSRQMEKTDISFSDSETNMSLSPDGRYLSLMAKDGNVIIYIIDNAKTSSRLEMGYCAGKPNWGELLYTSDQAGVFCMNAGNSDGSLWVANHSLS